MTTVLREVTPHALAIALSPFGVIVAILLLFTPRPRQSAGAFLSGWTVGDRRRVRGLRRAHVGHRPQRRACARGCPGSAAARQAECARRWLNGEQHGG